ncbi:MAG: hypothetical protein ACI81T_003449, partial [Bacteroidia bacterium]
AFFNKKITKNYFLIVIKIFFDADFTELCDFYVIKNIIIHNKNPCRSMT